MISILIPSRGRPEELLTSINSLGLNSEIEILVWLDSDDPKLEQYRELLKTNPFVRFFVKDRIGYKNFHLMVDFLARQAKYDWYFLFNDDSYMENSDWLKVFKDFVRPFEPTNQPIVINIWGQGIVVNNLFPIISRAYFDILGHISLTQNCDDWIRIVGMGANISYDLKGIKPKHRKYGGGGTLNDETFQETESSRAEFKKIWNEKRGILPKELLDNDIKRIIKLNRSTKPCRNCLAIKTVGFIGLGKLGLPVALAIESRGFKVVGYDTNPKVRDYVDQKKIPFVEKGIEPLLANTQIRVADSLAEVVKASDIIFCAIQTPHDGLFEGDRPLSSIRADFDYSYLVKAIKDVAAVDKDTTLVVISTCLPGTFEREIKPILTNKIKYIYNPFFIAMGTVVQDFLNPEFVLIGGDDTAILRHFYIKIHAQDKTFITDITTAEGIKVFYNTFITTKTVLANLYGEFAHKTRMNVDHIYEALTRATDRLISPKYLKSGVGDGGGCHPRDNIALSFLAKKLDISFNYFDSLMTAREKHMEWLADVFAGKMRESGLPGIILGKSFKPETEIQTGSPAILLANILRSKSVRFEHYEFDYPKTLPVATYFIATQHSEYPTLSFPAGSIVIDPFRYIPTQTGVKITAIGGNI